mgnify:CR=1 FL=1
MDTKKKILLVEDDEALAKVYKARLDLEGFETKEVNNGEDALSAAQEFKPDLSDAFLEMRRHGIQVTIAGTDGCEILPELERRPDERVIVKKRYSAFFGTALDELLRTLRDEQHVAELAVNSFRQSFHCDPPL